MKNSTIKEVMANFAGQYVECEIYEDRWGWGTFHTDNIFANEDIDDDAEVLDYELMSESNYADTVLANSCVVADFADWFGDANAKVLCILVAKQ